MRYCKKIEIYLEKFEACIMVVIAICGFRRSGKDTIADFIETKYQLKKIRIAGPLKEACKALFGFSEEAIETDIKEVIDDRYGASPRQIMQFMGTEIMQYEINKVIKGFNRDFFIRRTLIECKKYNEQIVIADLRFVHEYEFLKQQYNKQLKVIRVERSHNLIDMHISEQDFIKIPTDFIVTNNDDKVKLFSQIDNIFNQM